MHYELLQHVHNATEGHNRCHRLHTWQWIGNEPIGQWLRLAAMEVVYGSKRPGCPVIKHLLDYVEDCKNEHTQSHMRAKKLLQCTENGHVVLLFKCWVKIWIQRLAVLCNILCGFSQGTMENTQHSKTCHILPNLLDTNHFTIWP